LGLTLKHTKMKIEYRNVYIHYILTTLHRIPVISEVIRNRLEKYITGIINNSGSKLYAVYINPEHTHILLSKSPDISDNELVDKIAHGSARFINENKLITGKFAWQDSASAFSVSKGDIDRICKYILNQKEHHKKVTFEEEYQSFIKYYQNSLAGNKT
jgi:putative transposase